MTDACVFVAGSARAEELIAPIADRLKLQGVNVCRHIGQSVDLRHHRNWRDADVLVAADIKCARKEFDAAPNLRAVISPLLGVDGIDETAATRSGLLVVRGEVAENSESMAEATMMVLLAALYDLPRKIGDCRAGLTRAKSELRSRMLKCKTIGIVGFGSVSKALIARLAGWQVRILVYARKEMAAETGVEFVPLPNLLSQSDVIVLLSSLNDESRHLLNHESIGLAKAGAIIVNTARGGLIEETALIDAMQRGRLSYVALDVFETEPLALSSPLRDLPNAILTPHSVGHTIESIEAIRAKTVCNVVEVLRGRAPHPVRNSQILAHWLKRWGGHGLV